jgi:hypothetical protein
VIISRGRRYIFVHIPKTGGTSLSLALEERAKRDDLLVGDTPKALRRKHRLKGLASAGRLWKHSTLADIDGILTPQELEGMFTFCIVRNPWDRVVSYYHWLRSQSFEHRSVLLAKSRSFEGFLRDRDLQDSLRLSPARFYMTDATGTERCRLCIRLEAFRADAAPLFEHLGFEVSLPHLNASARATDFRTYYTDELAGIVADVCAEDIDRFRYAFNPDDTTQL